METKANCQTNARRNIVTAPLALLVAVLAFTLVLAPQAHADTMGDFSLSSTSVKLSYQQYYKTIYIYDSATASDPYRCDYTVTSSNKNVADPIGPFWGNSNRNELHLYWNASGTTTVTITNDEGYSHKIKVTCTRTAKDAYLEKRFSLQDAYKISEDYNWKYVDLNGDGVKEMLLHGYWMMGVYTYNKKRDKVVKVKTVDTGKGYAMPLRYSKKKHRFSLFTASTGGSEMWVYRMKGSKAKLVKKYTYVNGKFRKSHKPVYKINGKTVKERTYNKSMKKALKGFKKLKSLANW